MLIELRSLIGLWWSDAMMASWDCDCECECDCDCVYVCEWGKGWLVGCEMCENGKAEPDG